jgi:tetratricopeptide (TPR) repeat protein
MVNARRGEILQGSSSVRVYAWGDGTPTEMPSTPQEYIEMNKKTLGREFSGYQFIAAEESRLANKPAARLLYSYEGNKGRITEESITLFGVGVTFQFICESPASKYDEYRPCFQSILESFRIGRDSPAEAAIVESGSDTTSADQSPEQLYNKATSLYRNGEFEQAMQAFDQCFRSGEYQMLAAYARCLCQRELGLEIEIPQELGDQAETAGVVYVASNLACHLIAQGHQAALTKQDGTSEVRANIGGSLYLIHISSLLGAFLNMAWRQEEDKNIPVADRSVNPNPTEADKFVESLLEKASSLPPSPLPKGGLRTTLE